MPMSLRHCRKRDKVSLPLKFLPFALSDTSKEQGRRSVLFLAVQGLKTLDLGKKPQKAGHRFVVLEVKMECFEATFHADEKAHLILALNTKGANESKGGIKHTT